MSDDILQRLTRIREHDVPTRGGRTLAYVYDSGLADVDQAAREAVAAFAGTNGLDPTAFPSLLRMENDLVGFACDLLDAPDSAVGTLTSGGTESVLLAVQTARDAHPEITDPRMVLPSTAHAAFRKAAHYFGIRLDVVPVGADHRPDPAAMAARIGPSTVLVVASAPSYAHGVVDPVGSIAAVAADRGVRCHVDACIGGWVLPYAARLGRSVAPWTFAVPGVTSISVDLHKYAYAPKGASLLLHRTPELRRPQFFASADWPGYTMLNTTMQSTKSGGPLAGAWTALQAIGDDGYLQLTRALLAAVDGIVSGVERIEGLHLVARPDASLVVLGTGASCDVFTLTDLLHEAGWYVQPQLSFAGEPPSLHLSVSPATDADAFLAALREVVARARGRGRVRVDPGVAAFVTALDPASLTDEDIDNLLVAVGMRASGGDAGLPESAAGVDLPESMAQINALLDLASPPLREALLIAYLDRLSRPTRRCVT